MSINLQNVAKIRENMLTRISHENSDVEKLIIDKCKEYKFTFNIIEQSRLNFKVVNSYTKNLLLSLLDFIHSEGTKFSMTYDNIDYYECIIKNIYLIRDEVYANFSDEIIDFRGSLIGEMVNQDKIYYLEIGDISSNGIIGVVNDFVIDAIDKKHLVRNKIMQITF